MRSFVLSGALLAAFVLALGAAPVAAGKAPARAGGKAMSFALRSAAFAPNSAIPAKHTCEGADISPPLAWSGAPAGTKSFALIVDDPDAPDPAAPRVVWVHWVLYDIPASATSLAEHTLAGTLPAGTRQGLNDWKQPGWRGPCPPIGRHRYFFKLYALDAVLPELATADKPALLKAMKDHVLATAELVGTYAKQK